MPLHETFKKELTPKLFTLAQSIQQFFKKSLTIKVSDWRAPEMFKIAFLTQTCWIIASVSEVWESAFLSSFQSDSYAHKSLKTTHIDWERKFSMYY